MAPSPAPLEIRLLGGFACSVHGSPATGVNYDKMRALLAYLAVGQGRDHQREALAELLWSGNDPVTARGNLRRTLSDLRRVLESPAGPPLFEASRNSLRLLAPARVDVHLFLAPAPAAMAPHAHHTRLTQLYAGEFMAGFHLPDSPEFDHWLQVQRQTLHRRALALLEQLSNFHEPLGDYDRALPFALRQLELEPWDESAHRRVIRLHALAGQVGAALSQFDACCRVLQQELGIAPGPETQQLVKQIHARQDSPAQQARSRSCFARCARTTCTTRMTLQSDLLRRGPDGSAFFRGTPATWCRCRAAACSPISATRWHRNCPRCTPCMPRWPCCKNPPKASECASAFMPAWR